MTELLENSDNTNADTGVRESSANEATISLAVAQSLADALQKIESYTPTVWVDNESPDIDAAHLNKAEQAIMRVTTAMNSAVDVIKDLQSQVNTTNNNLSKCLSPRDTLKESADNCRRNGCWRVNGNYQSVNGVNDGILLTFDATGNENVIYQQLFNNVGPALYVRRYWFNGWSAWVDIALKSDLYSKLTYSTKYLNNESASLKMTHDQNVLIIGHSMANGDPNGYFVYLFCAGNITSNTGKAFKIAGDFELSYSWADGFNVSISVSSSQWIQASILYL